MHKMSLQTETVCYMTIELYIAVYLHLVLTSLTKLTSKPMISKILSKTNATKIFGDCYVLFKKYAR